MLQTHRLILLGAVSLALLSGCGSTSIGTESGTILPPTSGSSGGGTGSGPTGGFTKGGSSTGTHDTIVATPAVAGVVSVVVGASQIVSVTFTSSDGLMMTGFGITSTSLPAGWSAPASFGCATVSTGSGCVLNLKYLPTAYNSGGTLTLHYLYVDNSGEPVTSGGSTTLNFQATTHNNVVSAPTPVGQINATNLSSQTVIETFTTDDGFPASALSVDLSALPADWHAAAPFTCASVSAGTPCQLALTYTPTMPAVGTLTLNYTFKDDSGTAKAMALNVAYAATSNNNVNYVTSPIGPISVVSGSGASQAVTVTFTTNDGYPASSLMVDLSSLPSTWTSPSSPAFSCGTVSAGTPCQLTITYTPTGPVPAGMLQAPYSYFDNAGAAKTGTVNIAYSST